MRICTFIFLALIFFYQPVFSQAPTTPASNVTFTSIDGGSFRVNWTNGNGTRRIVIARQGAAVTATPVNGVDYNHNNVFGSGDAIQPGQFVVADVISNFVDVSNLHPSTTYHFAIYEYNGTGASTVYIATAATANQATLSAPTIQTSAVLVTNITGNAMRLDWTNGNGQRRLVVARAAGPVNANPVDLVSYNGSASFTTGTQIGTGNYAVLASTVNNVTVTNLQPSTTYHFALFEYNGLATPVYLVPGTTVNATTAARPSVAATNVTFTSVEGGSMRVNWVNGNGSRRMVVARAGSVVTATPVDGTDYTHNNSFGTGDDLGSNQYVVHDGTANFVDVNNLAPNTTYHFRIYEYDGTGATSAYQTASFASGSQSTLAAPTVQASNILFSNISGSGVTVSWTNGNGARRIVLARAGGAVNADPVTLSAYTSSTTFGIGSQVGIGNYIVYSSTGNTVNITNLLPNTAYHFAVYEYNGAGGPVYLTPGATANITTSAQPTVPASAFFISSPDGGSMRVNWTNGNGTRRIVVGRAGSAVTALPVDGSDYASNPNFTLAEAIAPGQVVVFDGISNFVDVSGLHPATTYHFAVFEYNGSGATTAYLVTSFPSGSQATVSAPAMQASNMNFTNLAGTSLTVNWTNGNGTRRTIVARQGSAVNSEPVNLSIYTASTIFGSGSQMGSGNFVIGNHTSGSASITVTNLVPNTTYHFAIFESNGSSGPVYLVPGLTGNFTTAAQPTVASSNINFTGIDGNAFRVNWTSGNGSRRIVIARQGSVVTAVPADGTDYVASNVFGSGDAILPGQFVVLDGFSTFVDLSGLSPSTTYHFAIFEYDGTGSGTTYLTSSFLVGNQSTLSPPTQQASNLTFTSVGATTMTVNWTVGNGARKLIVARQGSAVNADPVNLTLYTANGNFGLGTQLGTGNYTVYNGIGSNFNLTGLISGTTYHFAIYEFNGSSGPVYLVPGAIGNATTIGAPQMQATNASPSNIAATNLQIGWTNGSGNRRLVLMKQGSAVDGTPVDNTPYTANSFFSSGTQIGSGNYVVFDGTGSSVTVSNLLSSTQYHFAVFEFNSFGASSQFLVTNPARGDATTLSVLPVHLISFRAISQNNKVKLEWATAQEQNSSHFEIQKSTDGTVFTTTGAVDAAGNSNNRNNYSFLDENPGEGITYYRLREVDLDGSFNYSRIVSLRFQPKGLIKSFINPITSIIDVRMYVTVGQKSEWRISDIRGVLLMRKDFSGNQITENISSLKPGMYILELQSGTVVERIRLIKIEGN